VSELVGGLVSLSWLVGWWVWRECVLAMALVFDAITHSAQHTKLCAVQVLYVCTCAGMLPATSPHLTSPGMHGRASILPYYLMAATSSLVSAFADWRLCYWQWAGLLVALTIFPLQLREYVYWDVMFSQAAAATCQQYPPPPSLSKIATTPFP
jgi:hypothetical protein